MSGQTLDSYHSIFVPKQVTTTPCSCGGTRRVACVRDSILPQHLISNHLSSAPMDTVVPLDRALHLFPPAGAPTDHAESDAVVSPAGAPMAKPLAHLGRSNSAPCHAPSAAQLAPVVEDLERSWGTPALSGSQGESAEEPAAIAPLAAQGEDEVRSRSISPVWALDWDASLFSLEDAEEDIAAGSIQKEAATRSLQHTEESCTVRWLA